MPDLTLADQLVIGIVGSTIPVSLGKLKKQRKQRPTIITPQRARVFGTSVATAGIVAGAIYAGHLHLPPVTVLTDLLKAPPQAKTAVAQLPPPVIELQPPTTPQPSSPETPTSETWLAVEAETTDAPMSPLPIGAPIPVVHIKPANTVLASKGEKGEGPQKGKQKDSGQTVESKVSSLMLVDQAAESEASKNQGKSSANPASTIAQNKAIEQPASRPSGNEKTVHKPLTIVDIARDGAYVLLTNPDTRLPQQFKVGQKIFTGEVISQINHKTGQMVTDQRTVSMN